MLENRKLTLYPITLSNVDKLEGWKVTLADIVHDMEKPALDKWAKLMEMNQGFNGLVKMEWSKQGLKAPHVPIEKVINTQP